MSNVSVIAAIRKDKPRKDGTCAILIRYIFQRKVISTTSIGKYVDAKHWDEIRRCVKKSAPNYLVLNSIINNRICSINEKFERFIYEGKTITKTAIINIANGKDAGADYFQYALNLIPIKYCEARQKETRRSYFGELTKLKKYKSELNFYDIDVEFLQGYRAYMLTTLNNHPNTVWKSFKFLKSMINSAIKSNDFSGKNPFINFDSGKYQQGVRGFLEMSDIEEIFKTVRSNLPLTIKQVGYYYLFMCFSGLRFTDTMNFRKDIHVIDDERITMKTHKKGVVVNLFIHSRLREVIEFISLNPLQITNQQFNKYLKVLAEIAGVKVQLTAHIGRHTFGAMLAEMETPKEVAQKLLGHSDIRSTNVYYHLKDKSMDNAMSKWDDL